MTAKDIRNNVNNFDITTARQQSYIGNDAFGIKQNNEQSSDQDKVAKDSAKYLINNSKDELLKIKNNFKTNEKLLQKLNDDNSQYIKQIHDMLTRDNKAESHMYSLMSNLCDSIEGANYSYVKERLVNKKDKKGLKELLIIFSSYLNHNYYSDAKQFQSDKNDKNNMLKKYYDDIERNPDNVKMDKKLINGFIKNMNDKLK